MNLITKEFADTVEQQFKSLNENVKEGLEKSGAIDARLTDIEQKLARARHHDGGRDSPATWGAEVSNAPELKEFAAEAQRKVRPGRVGFELKASITSVDTSGGALAQPYLDNAVMMPQRRLRVRDLLPVVKLTSGSFMYPKQSVRTFNAAPVAEGLQKPESALSWTMETGTPKVLAHWIPASRQILDDASQLAGLIDTELRYGLALVEDAQILAGDGTGENLPGLITEATPYDAPMVIAGSTMLDEIGLAILQLTLLDFTPSGIVMHPSDWMRICLLKDADGHYIVGDPIRGSVVSANGQGMSPMLFGIPVVPTASMEVGKFLVGDFKVAATLYDRWEARVEISTEHADFFTRNMVAILAEERVGQAIKQAGALIYGEFAPAA